MLEANRVQTIIGKASDLWSSHSRLLDEMMWDRRVQFCEEMGWDLNVDAKGREIDDYDHLNPQYVVLRDYTGCHLGSGRLLPMSGRTMLEEVFGDMLPENFDPKPGSLEVTRVFVPKGKLLPVERMLLTVQLMLGGVVAAIEQGAPELWGCTYPAMVKVFSRAGWPVDVHETADMPGFGVASFCRWPVNDTVHENLHKSYEAMAERVAAVQLAQRLIGEDYE